MSIKDMLGRSGVVSREEAVTLLNSRLVLPGLPEEEVQISAALGRVLAADISSPVDLPDFDRSTVDGYAVRSLDTFGAAESRPALLTVAGEVFMGRMPDGGLARGEAMKIPTGGALPSGADAVVMFEQTQEVDAASIEVMKPVALLENVIRAGDDIKRGETILNRGHRIRPQDMGALAGIGITSVKVFEKPRVAIISTGNEIIPADAVPGPGQIRDSNSYNLEGLISQCGATAVKKGIVPDDESRLRTVLDEALHDCHLVLITGGSSVGTADLSAKVVNEAGTPGVLVHGVSIRPGKPLIVGLIGQVPVFGLPGHPAAVSICFELFVRPVLLRMTGEIPSAALEGVPSSRIVHARLSRSVASSPGREDHVRVMLEKRADGLWALPVFGPSGLVSTLVKAVGTVVIPVNKIGIEAGEHVEVRLF
jgi:molybdopterin molybdotransferase